MTINGSSHRLYKSRRDRMLDGVCGGLAEYLSLDSSLVRLAWVLLTFLGGSGVLLYIVAMVIMPNNPEFAVPAAQAPAARSSSTHERNTRFWGILLIVVGSIWFLGNIGVPFFHHWWWWDFSWEAFFPVALILIGVAFIFGGRNSMVHAGTPAQEASASAAGIPPEPSPSPVRRLSKSRADKKIFGVCGGLANHLGFDPTIIRLAFVLAAFASFGLALLIYVVMAIVFPMEPIDAVTTS
jgi:phage shock protein C